MHFSASRLHALFSGFAIPDPRKPFEKYQTFIPDFINSASRSCGVLTKLIDNLSRNVTVVFFDVRIYLYSRLSALRTIHNRLYDRYLSQKIDPFAFGQRLGPAVSEDIVAVFGQLGRREPGHVLDDSSHGNFDLVGPEHYYPAQHIGNGHLLRGGNARTMQGDAAYLQKRFMEMFSPWVTEETFSKEKIYLEKWRNERQEFFRDGRDLLFYMHHDFRIGMFAAPLNMHTSATAFFVYPFMDERISRYAAGLTVFDRVSERVAFGAVKLLAPQLADIGLFKEIWRFDRSPERKDFIDSDRNYQTGFEKRKPRSCSLHDDTFIIQDKIANGNLHGTMAEFILDSSFSCELRKFLARDAYDEISYRARRGANTQPSFYRNMDAVQRFRFDQFFCRAFIACSLYDTSWR